MTNKGSEYFTLMNNLTTTLGKLKFIGASCEVVTIDGRLHLKFEFEGTSITVDLSNVPTVEIPEPEPFDKEKWLKELEEKRRIDDLLRPDHPYSRPIVTWDAHTARKANEPMLGGLNSDMAIH